MNEKKDNRVQIEVTVSRREYIWHESKVAKSFRLVGILDDETKEYHLYVANVPPEQMTPKDIAKTYAARWEVELIFKELKSYYRIIDQLPSVSQPVVESLIYTAILTLVVSRALLFELRRRKKLSVNEAPVRRWVVVFHSIARKVLSLFNHSGRNEKMWLMLEEYIFHELKDPIQMRIINCTIKTSGIIYQRSFGNLECCSLLCW